MRHYLFIENKLKTGSGIIRWLIHQKLYVVVHFSQNRFIYFILHNLL